MLVALTEVTIALNSIGIISSCVILGKGGRDITALGPIRVRAPELSAEKHLLSAQFRCILFVISTT